MTGNKRTRILAVEDDLSTRAALFGLLADESFEVTRSNSAEGALEALRTGHFDVVLTDDRLPGQPGIWIAARAHEEGLLPHARVVLLTADPMAETNEWLTVLHKPLGPRGLVKAIGAVLRQAAH
jgi:CheY-like chemotaxis protein